MAESNDEKEQRLKFYQTILRHMQGMLKLKPEIERERDNLLAELNTERGRGETNERH